MTEQILAVLIPVFNDKEGLRVSLDSLHHAMRPEKMMTIVVDDGSSQAIKYDMEDAAIGLRIIRILVNQGIEQALIAGIKEAVRVGATIVARLDAGDTIAEDRLIRQLEVLENDPAIGLVGCSANFVNSDGVRLFMFSPPRSDILIRRQMHINSCVLHTTAMFRMSILECSGGGIRLNFLPPRTMICFFA